MMCLLKFNGAFSCVGALESLIYMNVNQISHKNPNNWIDESRQKLCNLLLDLFFNYLNRESILSDCNKKTLSN